MKSLSQPLLPPRDFLLGKEGYREGDVVNVIPLTALLGIFGKEDRRRGSRKCDQPLQISWIFC